MSRRRWAGWAAVALLVVLAGALAVLAADVLRWRGHLERTDLRVGSSPANTGMWIASTRVPGDPAATLLGVDDDVEIRRALQSFLLANPRRPARNQEDLNKRLAADSRLADLSDAGASAAMRSRAAMLRGILALEAARGEPLRASTLLRRSLDELRTSIRLDDANADAKYNLELVMRLLRTVEEESPGSGQGQDRGRGDDEGQGAGSSESSSGF
jgi:hypothetical protein